VFSPHGVIVALKWPAIRAHLGQTLDLVADEGIFAGTSSGAALGAATQLAGRRESADKIIVAVLPDIGERFLASFK